ncbi:MAG: IS66 family transposase, partial [candidate division KSB1 bacterium]|nr:IS66 family transposase [candidate division KSB1 bacterium]
RQSAPVTTTKVITYTRKEKSRPLTPPSRHPLPASLPREEILIEPQEDVTGMKKIGEEITEELEYTPGKLYVKRYIRPKYARPEGEGVVVGTLPSRPIDKGIAGPGLLAHVLISKYVDHLPLYRQRQQFRRHEVELAESTLCDWVKASCELLNPLSEALRDEILRQPYLMADETPMRVLDSSQPGKCHLGYHWVYYAPLVKLAYFDYQPSRSRDAPQQLLKNFAGHLQTDGYAAYEVITRRPEVTAVGCWAHGRRYFVEAQDNDRERAEWMLSQIQQLYHLERQARDLGLSHDERYRLRQESAQPILITIKAWLDQQVRQVLPKSALGKAMGYTLGQWSKLEKYLSDGRLEIDNNLIENAIRPVALGRKNYLFAGSHEGAKRAALIYSLVATAKLHDVEPFAYLKDVLTRIADYPISRVAELLPQNWKTPSQI